MTVSFRAIASAIATILALVSCGGGPESAAATTVPYEELDWKNDVHFLDGERFTGTAIAFHPDGTTKKSEIGLEDGVYHGVVREWWTNGNLQTETGFKKGKRHGKNTYWDEGGNLIKEQVYDMDTEVSVKVYQ